MLIQQTQKYSIYLNFFHWIVEMSDFHSMKLCHSVNWEEPKEVTEWHNLVIRSHFWPFSKNSADCMAQFFLMVDF